MNTEQLQNLKSFIPFSEEGYKKFYLLTQEFLQGFDAPTAGDGEQEPIIGGNNEFAFKEATFENIDRTTKEGQLLFTAISVIGFLKFRDKNASMIIEVLKDIRGDLFREESLEVTMERMIEKHQSKNN